MNGESDRDRKLVSSVEHNALLCDSNEEVGCER